MRYLARTLAAISVCVFIAPASDAREARNPAQNAALQYWQALALLPDDPRGTQWEVAQRSFLTAPVTDAEFLLQKSGISSSASWALDCLRRGARAPRCDWELPIREVGFDLRLQHTQRSSTASGLLLFSARREYSRGTQEIAVDDLIAAWRFCRHLANDKTLVTWRGHFNLTKNRVIPLAAAWVPELEQPLIDRLSDHLAQLPEPPAFSEVLRTYGEMWLVSIQSRVDRAGLDSTKDDLLKSIRHRSDLSKEEIDDLMSNEIRLLAAIEEASHRLDDACRIADLPWNEFVPAMAEFHKAIPEWKPLTRLILNGFGGDKRPVLMLKYAEARDLAYVSMFNAAIALRLHGAEGFETATDPFSGGPFQIEHSEGGYTLTSALVVDGEPVSLRFGKGAIPEPDESSRLLIYDPDANSAADIAAALERAARENKRVLLQWGFNGCIPCYRLHRYFDDNERLSKILDEHFVRLTVDVTKDENKQLIQRYGVPLPDVPQLTVLDAEQAVLANIKPNDEFYRDGNLDGNLIEASLMKWISERNAAARE